MIEGQLNQRINGKDQCFTAREICIIDQDSIHADYLLKEYSIVVFLGISDSFFEESIMVDSDMYNAEKFIRDTIQKRRSHYQFVRCIPRSDKTEVYELFGKILIEINGPRAGTVRLVQGYVERLLSLLPVEYHVTLTQREQQKLQRLLYDDIRAYITQNHQTVSIEKLSEEFGYNRDYFNRLIRRQSGLSYTQLVQSIRLEKAEYYLKSTPMPIEKIAQLSGYSNLGYFYRSFYEKNHMTPNEFRR